MNENLNALCYIQEQTSYEDNYKNFGYEVYDKGNRFYVIFEAVLQSFGTMNRNKRYYEAANIMDCINNDEQIQSLLKQNSWIGEIDHPSPEYIGQELTISRISTPSLRYSSHYIRKPRLNGNLLEATIQTDSATEHGMNMAIKIVDGKIIPCFSARVLGELHNKNGKPTVHVKKLVTYDFVLFPSHREATAKFTQPLQESVQQVEKDINTTIIFLPELAKMAVANSREANFICESFDLSMDDLIGVTETGNSVVLTENQNIYVQPITDKFVRSKTKSILNDWLKK